jgi:hypothetical protein
VDVGGTIADLPLPGHSLSILSRMYAASSPGLPHRKLTVQKRINPQPIRRHSTFEQGVSQDFLSQESQFQHFRTTNEMEWATIFAGTASLWVFRDNPSNLPIQEVVTGKGERNGLNLQLRKETKFDNEWDSGRSGAPRERNRFMELTHPFIWIAAGGLVTLATYVCFCLLRSAQGLDDAEEERLWQYLLHHGS